MAVGDQEISEAHALYLGDCCDVLPGLPAESVDLSIFSPPFADLYCYSESACDLANAGSHNEFLEHFGFVVEELRRVVKPGRIVAVHCADLPIMKQREGYIGLRDFPGDVVRLFLPHGFIFHSRHTIWKDPLIEAVRTKSLGLMHKQLCKDSSMSRAGIADQLLAFRVPGENALPVDHPDGLRDYIGGDDPGGEGVKRSHNIWRAYASPVWMDIRQSRTLNAKMAREADDEKHLCPLQLDVIERCLVLWSNPGETVLTPFMGVGSEVYAAIINGRRGIGIELKESYYRQAQRNIDAARKEWLDHQVQPALELR